MLKKIILILIVLVIVVIAGIYFYRNMIVETAIEESGKYVLGVETDLGSAGLEIGAGSLELNDYMIANPEGFESENFLVIEHGVLAVETGSIFDNEIIIDSLILENIFINIEQVDMKNNIKVLMDNLMKIDFGESSDSDRLIKIKKVAINNINVDASVSILDQDKITKSFTVDNINLKNVGGENGATLEEITQKLFKELLSKTAAQSQKLLPIDINQKVDELKDEAKDKLETEAKENLKKIGL